jgi:hypothetical protein
MPACKQACRVHALPARARHAARACGRIPGCRVWLRVELLLQASAHASPSAWWEAGDGEGRQPRQCSSTAL